MWPLMSGGQPTTVAAHDAPIREIALIEQYWDTRQAQPVHTQQLPELCYALSVQYPRMVVGTADRNIIVFNLQKPQTEYRRITSPLKYQTRSVAAFPDQQGFMVGSIEGRVGVHHLDDAQQSKNFTFKCHREGSERYSVNSLSFHPVNLLETTNPLSCVLGKQQFRDSFACCAKSRRGGARIPRDAGRFVESQGRGWNMKSRCKRAKGWNTKSLIATT